MTRDIWQQKTDEELMAASEHLSDYTTAGEAMIRAELQRRHMPEPPITEREVIDDGIKLNRAKGALRGVAIAAAVIVGINLVDAYLIEQSISRGAEKKEMLGWMIELLIVALAGAVGAFVGIKEKKRKIVPDEEVAEEDPKADDNDHEGQSSDEMNNGSSSSKR